MALLAHKRAEASLKLMWHLDRFNKFTTHNFTHNFTHNSTLDRQGVIKSPLISQVNFSPGILASREAGSTNSFPRDFLQALIEMVLEEEEKQVDGGK